MVEEAKPNKMRIILYVELYDPIKDLDHCKDISMEIVNMIDLEKIKNLTWESIPHIYGKEKEE